MAFRGLPWEKARDVAAGALAAANFDPPWMFPSVNELKCKLGYGCAGSMPPGTAAQRLAEAADEEAKVKASKLAMQEYDEEGRPKGPPGWPWGVAPNEKTVWTPKDVEELRVKLPGYKIKGPGSRAICNGQGMLHGEHLRLLETRRGIRTVEEAAAICDDMEDCTHFWITVGPDYPSMVDWDTGVPYRAEFCGGPMVSVLDDTNQHSFVGIKKNWVRDHGLPPPKIIPPIPGPEGALEAYGRDVGYYRSAREKMKTLQEAQKLDRLQSEANQLTAIQKKQQAEGVKAQLKSMQQQLPVIAPVKGTVKSRRGAEFL